MYSRSLPGTGSNGTYEPIDDGFNPPVFHPPFDPRLVSTETRKQQIKSLVPALDFSLLKGPFRKPAAPVALGALKSLPQQGGGSKAGSSSSSAWPTTFGETSASDVTIAAAEKIMEEGGSIAAKKVTEETPLKPPADLNGVSDTSDDEDDSDDEVDDDESELEDSSEEEEDDEEVLALAEKILKENEAANAKRAAMAEARKANAVAKMAPAAMAAVARLSQQKQQAPAAKPPIASASSSSNHTASNDGVTPSTNTLMEQLARAEALAKATYGSKGGASSSSTTSARPPSPGPGGYSSFLPSAANTPANNTAKAANAAGAPSPKPSQVQTAPPAAPPQQPTNGVKATPSQSRPRPAGGGGLDFLSKLEAIEKADVATTGLGFTPMRLGGAVKPTGANPANSTTATSAITATTSKQALAAASPPGVGSSPAQSDLDCGASDVSSVTASSVAECTGGNLNSHASPKAKRALYGARGGVSPSPRAAPSANGSPSRPKQKPSPRRAGKSRSPAPGAGGASPHKGKSSPAKGSSRTGTPAKSRTGTPAKGRAAPPRSLAAMTNAASPAVAVGNRFRGV